MFAASFSQAIQFADTYYRLVGTSPTRGRIGKDPVTHEWYFSYSTNNSNYSTYPPSHS